MRIELLTAPGCHLCDQAQQLIARAAPQADIELMDIGENDDLIEQYGELIPVLRCARGELRWPFSLLDVRGLLSVGE